MTDRFAKIANRFGLRVEHDTDLSRHGAIARFGDVPDVRTTVGRHEAFCRCLGTRLGLDLLAHTEPVTIGDLEWTQRLVPQAVTRLAEAISGRELQVCPWLDRTPLDVVFTRETGKLLVAAEVGDAVDGDNARRALFYAAYKLRPAETTSIAAGRVLSYQTTGGLASSVATLLPDFDLDAARDHGHFAVPGYDRLLIFRPNDSGQRGGAELRRVVRAAVTDAKLPLSWRLYSLRRDRIIPAEVCGNGSDFAPAHRAYNLLEVVT